MQLAEPQSSKWLKSPLSEKSLRLRSSAHLVVRPYFGVKKKLQLIKTHYLIGSGPECDIVLNDPFICPKHAELKLGTDGYFIQDLDSKNGVFVNGVKVAAAPLYANGSLRLGRSHIFWSLENDDADLDSKQWVFADPFMLETIKRLRQIAKSNLSVLLLGETGTGKEILAQMLHCWSNRANSPLITLNGALTGGSLVESELFGHKKGAYTGSDTTRQGALKSANGGTLFLDEIADVSLTTQVKLLRALENGEVKSLGSDSTETVDFRLVSATSQNIEMKIQEGGFRLDLYYRVAGYVVHIPPLRDRPRDILAIAHKILADKDFELDEECHGRLLSYPWPGNVRELRASLERAMVMARNENSNRILPQHFEGLERNRIFAPAPSGTITRTLIEIEMDAIRESLIRNGWSRGISAKELGIARSTLFEKMKRFKIRDEALLQD